MPAQDFPLHLLYKTQVIFILQEFSPMLSSYSSPFHPVHKPYLVFSEPLWVLQPLFPTVSMAPCGLLEHSVLLSYLKKFPRGRPTSCLLHTRRYSSSEGISLPPSTLWLQQHTDVRSLTSRPSSLAFDALYSWSIICRNFTCPWHCHSESESNVSALQNILWLVWLNPHENV